MEIIQEEAMEFPIRLRVGQGLDRCRRDVAEWRHRRGPGDVVLLVPTRRRQHVIAVASRIAHAPVEGDEEVEEEKRIDEKMNECDGKKISKAGVEGAGRKWCGDEGYVRVGKGACEEEVESSGEKKVVKKGMM